MGSRNECQIDLVSKFSKELGEGELKKITKEVEDIIEQAKGEGTDIRKALEDFYTERKHQIRSSQQRIMLSRDRYKDLKTTVLANKAFKSPEEAIESLLHFNSKSKNGVSTIYRTRKTIAAQQMNILDTTFREFPGSKKSFETGEMSADLMRILSGDKVDDAKIDPATMAVAKALRKVYDNDYELKNQAGFAVGYIENYAGKQTHPEKNLRALGTNLDEARANWVTLATEVFEFKKAGNLADAATLEGKLNQSFDDLITRDVGISTSDDFSQLITGGGKSLENSRKLHFKNGDAMVKYYEALGINYPEMVIKDIINSTGKTAAAFTLGPNHPNVFKKLLGDAELMARGQGDKAEAKWKSKRKWLEHLYEESINPFKPASWSLTAKFFEKARKMADMTKLPTALATTVTDFAYGAGIRSLENGRNYLSNFAEVTKEISKITVNPKHRKKVMGRMGVFIDDIVIQTTDTRLGDTTSTSNSWFDKAHRTLMNATGLPTQALYIRNAFAKLASTDIAENIGDSWSKIPSGIRDTMGAFEIDEGSWRQMQEIGLTDFGDGTKGLTPEDIREASLDIFGGPGPKARKQRNMLAMNYGSYISELAELKSPTPGLKQNALKTMFDKNTLRGQIFLSALQYKSFALSMFDTLAGVKNIGDYSNLKRSQLAATTLLTSAGLGYSALAMKDMLKGKEPRDVTDPAVWKDSILQGGGATLYADFLLADYSKSYRNPIVDAAGPVASQVNDFASIFSSAIRGKPIGTKASRFVEKNLIPTVPIVGHYLNRKMFETINKSLNIRERKTKKRK